MARGRAALVKSLKRQYDPQRRYVDIAVRFHVCHRVEGEIVCSPRCSRIYGGRWDTEALCYVDANDVPDLGQLRVLELPCSEPQFAYIESGARVTEIEGGRGLGKSYSGLLVASKNVCDRPFIDGRVVSPTTELSQIQWDKYVPQMLATGWLLDGEDGVKEARHELWFINGVVVQFKSAHKPGRLASWGGGWAIVDENQDVSDKARGKLLFCLREGGGKWQMYEQQTPAAGEALACHDANVAAAADDPADAKVIHAESRSNIFIDHDVFDYASRRMSREQYAIEVLGDWETVRRLAAEDALKPVFPPLVDEWKRYERGDAGDYPHVWRDEPDMWSDVTPIVVRSKLGVVPGSSWRWIAGVDPGTAVPNCCTVWRVFIKHHQAQPDWRAPRFLNLDSERQWLRKQRLYWVAWDFFEELGHCGHLGEAILDADGPNGKKAYAANTMVIVPDFTTWARTYQRQANGDGRAARGGGNFGQAAARLLQKSGFHVVKRPNPRVPASVQDVMEKIDPAVGEPRLLFRLPYAVRLFQNMATVLWDERGLDFDRSVPNDPTDSGRYPISMFDPAARIDSSGVQGVRLAR